ncbi:DUF4367 domain-containing protein [Bacillus carboniphilus]|uniref:DUF4367 domain-containing protein n=1 Tax=Bacillus carboniphilus TaxID=86663 RepID=A0ABY9JSD3_9BACI|nr:DUF4367 domain-containing protein [Bacillus carboniphilus]WLR42306.1 DUF4367 domain-containing protein [Bacillus carboniphilus]
MKKIIILMITSIFLIGCNSSGGSNLVTYDNDKLAKEIEEKGFKPKLPTKFPIAIINHEISSPPTNDHFIVDFTGEKGEYFELIIWDKLVTWNDNSNQEEININGKEGSYMSDEVLMSTLHWRDGDYDYILQYYHTFSDTKIAKADLIGIAESFQ